MQSKPHTAYNEATAEADIGRIKDAYKKYGRNEADVTKRLVQLPNGRVDLVFTINEGEKTGIRDIKFVGNHAVSNYRLRGLMQTTTMNWLSWFKSTDVYDPDRLASDLEAIRRYYMKNGYADFQITNTDVAYQTNPPGYVITITMDEGPQYHVSSVAVVSNIPKVDGPALNQFVALRPGDVYDASSVDKSVEGITRDAGHEQDERDRERIGEEPHLHLEPAGREPREEVDGVRARLHVPQRHQHHDRPSERQRHQAGGEPPGLGLAEAPAEQQQDRGAQGRERGDDPDEIEQVAGYVHAQPFSRPDVVGGGAPPAPEDGDDDREADRHLGRRHHEREEHDDLAADVVERAGERHEREVRGVEHELDAHEHHQHVAPHAAGRRPRS